jgi:hypothetical protein
MANQPASFCSRNDCYPHSLFCDRDSGSTPVFQRQIEDSPRITLDETLKPLGYDAREPPENKLIYAQWKTLSLLEAASVEKRYHQAGLLLTARVSVIYFGFITGMILALVGATFILGKFRDEPARIQAEGGAGETSKWRASLETASPGLLLAALGTILMLTTMLAHVQIDVKDGPLYLLPGSAGPSPDQTAPPSDTEQMLQKNLQAHPPKAGPAGKGQDAEILKDAKKRLKR